MAATLPPPGGLTDSSLNCAATSYLQRGTRRSGSRLCSLIANQSDVLEIVTAPSDEKENVS